MEIIPVIYILDGRCVALYKGSYEQKATYMKSPIHMARFFEKEGAKIIHIVDLNGRKEGGTIQKELLQHLILEVQIPLQLEAAFSSLEAIRIAFGFGISKVVLRPRAYHIIQEAIRSFGPEKILVEIQAKGSMVTIPIPEISAGDTKTSLDIVDFAENLVTMGVKNIIYKNEYTEGTMINPSFDEVDRLIGVTGQDLNIYLSGGIGELKHLALLKKIGTTGAIIGKALYEKHFTFREALAEG